VLAAVQLAQYEGRTMSGCYKDLQAWRKSLELALEVYRTTQQFPKCELYGLTSQMRRAAVSIPSNIAEGKGRSSDRAFVVFLCHARGSLLELETQALVAQRLGDLENEDANHIEKLSAETGKILNGLINSLRTEHQEVPIRKVVAT
jgi:four helix bundle protein